MLSIGYTAVAEWRKERCTFDVCSSGWLTLLVTDTSDRARLER